MAGVRKIKRQNTLESAIEALHGYIIENNLKSGDRLPTEHEISAGLGISRNIIREAMQYFRALGVVDSKPRTGARIVDLIPKDLFKGYLPLILNDPNGAFEAVQMRMILECGAVALMVANCTDRDVEALRRLVAGMGEGQGYVEAEIGFHSLLLRMAGNRLVESMIPLTVEFFTRRRVRPDRHSQVARIIDEHTRIVDALAERSVERMAAALRDHYKAYEK